MAWMAWACNGDVFVDEVKPSVTEILLKDAGAEEEVRISSDDWGTIACFEMDGTVLSGTLYDENDRQLAPSLCYQDIKVFRFVHEDGETMFTISRDAEKVVRIRLEKNERTTPLVFELILSLDGNGDFHIPVTILPKGGEQ